MLSGFSSSAAVGVYGIVIATGEEGVFQSAATLSSVKVSCMTGRSPTAAFSTSVIS
jgi:hypothetical protein